MSLQVWLPFNGNTNNQGLAENCIIADSITYGEGGKLHKFYRNGGGLTLDKNYIGLCGSIAFWIYVDENTDYNPNTIFGNNNIMAGANNRKWTLHLYPNRNSLHSWGLQSDTSSTTPVGYFTVSNIIPDGVWTHICVTHSKDGKQTIYANGKQVFQNTVDISGTYTFDVETVVCYNENNIGIQDFRIYDHCLSKEEVKEISKGLVLHYNFEPIYGNENLILRSDKVYYAGSGSGVTGTALDDGSIKIVSNVGNANWCRLSFGNGSDSNVRDKMNVGDTYTISCDLKIESGDKLPMLFLNAGNPYKRLLGNPTVHNVWQRVYYTSIWNEPRRTIWKF